MRNILIISPENWDAHTVSKHHYAMTLAERGATVFFLNPPDETLSDITISRVAGYSNIQVVSSPRVAAGLRFYPAFLRRRLEQRWLEKLEKIAGVNISVVWLFENSRFYDLGFAGDRLKIYHQMDDSENFHIKEAAMSADICFGVTDFILKRLLNYNKNSYKIQHGFNDNIGCKLSCDKTLVFGKSLINVAIIGNLEIIYLDVELLSALVKAYPEISFHFVGNYNENGKLYEACKSAGNIVWWGKVDSLLIPSILKCCDVLLVTYQVDKYREQLANSHKIMEYMASGKVVVATYTDEYKDKRFLLEMVDDSNDFIQIFDLVINDLQFYNSEEKQAQRINFANDNTYCRQLDKINAILKDNNYASLLE